MMKMAGQNGRESSQEEPVINLVQSGLEVSALVVKCNGKDVLLRWDAASGRFVVADFNEFDFGG